MKIALCDDEKSVNEEMLALMSEYASVRGAELVCDTFASGEELLAAADRYDLYFLDYLMGGMNGVQTAEALRKKYNNSVTVCFLTSYETAAREIINHRIHADGFLKKPAEREELFSRLDALFSDSLYNRIVIKNGAGFDTLYPRDIVYVEAMMKNTVVHGFDGDREFPILLKDFEEAYLSFGVFSRVHRSFIVNLMHVSACNSRTVSLKDGTQLPLRRKKEFMKAYEEFNYSVNSGLY